MAPSDDHFPTASATTTMDERIEGVGVGGIKFTSNHIVIPPPSILVDTVQILNACEDAEVGGYVSTTGSCDDFNDEGGVRSSNNNNGDESVGPRFVLVSISKEVEWYKIDSLFLYRHLSLSVIYIIQRILCFPLLFPFLPSHWTKKTINLQ